MFFSFGTEEQPAIVLLINLDKSIQPKKLAPVCIIEEGKGENKHKTKVLAEILPIHDAQTSDCRLLNYRLACHSFELKNPKEIPKFSLSISEEKPNQVCFC